VLPPRGRVLVKPARNVLENVADGRSGILLAPSDGHVHDLAAALVEKDIAADVLDIDEEVFRVRKQPPEESAAVRVRVRSRLRMHVALVRALGGIVPAVDGQLEYFRIGENAVEETGYPCCVCTRMC
jgi:hypothetical protein